LASETSIDAIYRQATLAALLGLVINLVLGVVKLVGGLVGHSLALISDAVNSFGDVLTSLVVVFALRVAQTPPDDEHPYGHTRAEAIAGANVAVLVIISALLVAWEALQRFSTVHASPPAWTLWIAAANVVIKESLYRYKVRIGRKTESSALIANAWDHRSDAFCSMAVLVSLSIVRWGGSAWIGVDEIAALVVASAIVWTGVGLFRKSASELMDLQANQELVSRMRRSAESVPAVRAVEKLWVRKSGLEYFADIHIQVDQHLTVAEGHRIGHEVKDHLLHEYATLRDVLVHLEPYPHDHAARHQSDSAKRVTEHP
jgi:cation diffusion facilitator family transporter